ncbi:MAG: hypothetical protein FWC43_07795 [Planctomycetaceae bacterium]|nr:hypothetical protein [Planctomycetaceae bacterium]
MKVVERNFSECAGEILDSDLLLFRSRGLVPLAGRGFHSHAGKAAWWNGHLFLLEVREFYGGRAVLLESQVKKRPGQIDVFRANPDNRWPAYHRDKAVELMQRFAGCDYGYWNVLMAALTHLSCVRFFMKPDFDDLSETKKISRPPFCSQACAIADRIGGGIDPVPHLADRFTEPADLARSVFYKYLFTLK